jgi:protein-disulfide isomerase
MAVSHYGNTYLKNQMSYLLNRCRLPILSLLLSSLFLGALPATAAPEFRSTTMSTAPDNPIARKNTVDRSTLIPSPQDRIALDEAVKVSPQLEKQILEVIRRNPAVVMEVLQKYAIEQQRKEQLAQAKALQQLRKDTKALIGDSPVKGATDRKLVMVVFSDFQCSYCAAAEKNLKQFLAKHKEVTLVYKHFPLTQIHPEALPAATAAWAANKQGKFWEYHDALFTNQAKLGEAFYLETANNLKLDAKKFTADRKIAEAEIVKDFQLGRKLGIDGTPTFILNGEAISGAATVADFEKVLAQVNKK